MNRKLKSKIHEVIFEADTRAGKLFDVALISLIILSIAAVMLESVSSVQKNYGSALVIIEWVVTILFSIEYIFRLLSVGKPLKYVFSFFGIIDFLSIVPTYFSVLFPGTQVLIVIRVLRVLRIFRVLKFVQYIKEARTLRVALAASRRKITVFLFVVFTLVIILGSLMYLVEGEENGFKNIPTSIYWAVVTLTTVGYGDISPQTGVGQFLAALVMILGYSIIAVPTGIVTSELTMANKLEANTQSCPECSADNHDSDAVYCKYCGAVLNNLTQS